MERKKAVVTGASRGIGKGIARCLAREGYDLAISYATQREEAQNLVEELQVQYGGKYFCFQASLEQEDAGVKLLEESVKALGGLDLLVNNAGVTRFENILDLTPEIFNLLWNLDFKNYILMMQAAGLPDKYHLVPRGAGLCGGFPVRRPESRAEPGGPVHRPGFGALRHSCQQCGSWRHPCPGETPRRDGFLGRVGAEDSLRAVRHPGGHWGGSSLFGFGESLLYHRGYPAG